jgi:hypothetical protein
MGQFVSKVQILKTGTDMVPEKLVIFEHLTWLTAQDILLTLAAIKISDIAFIIKHNFITNVADCLW